MVVGVGEVCDGVVELLIDVGGLLCCRIATKPKSVGSNVGDGLEVDFLLPEILEVRPCLVGVGAVMPLFVLCAEQSSAEDERHRSIDDAAVGHRLAREDGVDDDVVDLLLEVLPAVLERPWHLQQFFVVGTFFFVGVAILLEEVG